MKIVICGLSVTSTWGNGHGTTYRALLRALKQRGHDIAFFEKDVEWYASNRDLPNPDFCRVELYENWSDVLPRVRSEMNDADVAMVGSYFPDGVAAVNEMADSRARLKTFYDIDTPITMKQLRERGATDYLTASQIAGLDIYFSFTGGPALRELEERFHARRAVPLYCSVEPQEHRRTAMHKSFVCDLSYMGTYAPDRQPKIDELLCEPARQLPDKKFVVAGPQYPRKVRWPKNVRHRNHLNPRYHATFYSSSRFTLNVTRRDMVMAGFSPSVRLFEAAACGTAIISDNWPGLETFYTPGKEILLPASSADVVRYLAELGDEEVRRIGDNAQRRVLAEHTSTQRALEFERAIETALSPPRKIPEELLSAKAS